MSIAELQEQISQQDHQIGLPNIPQDKSVKDSLNLESLFTYSPSTGRITINPSNAPMTPASSKPKVAPSFHKNAQTKLGFNSESFSRPYGVQPAFATAKDLAGNTIEMSINEIADTDKDQEQF